MNDHHVAGGDSDDDGYQVRYGNDNGDDEDDDGEMDHSPTIKDCHVLHNRKVCQRKVWPMCGDPSKVGEVDHLIFAKKSSF